MCVSVPTVASAGLNVISSVVGHRQRLIIGCTSTLCTWTCTEWDVPLLSYDSKCEPPMWNVHARCFNKQQFSNLFAPQVHNCVEEQLNINSRFIYMYRMYVIVHFNMNVQFAKSKDQEMQPLVFHYCQYYCSVCLCIHWNFARLSLQLPLAE